MTKILDVCIVDPSVLLVLCLVFTLLPVGATAAEATSGTCGSNLKWKLEDGTLTVSGTGAMYNYDYGSGRIQPWPGDSIEEVVIGSGVTSIGNYAFEECHSINSVTIGKDVKSIPQSDTGAAKPRRSPQPQARYEAHETDGVKQQSADEEVPFLQR